MSKILLATFGSLGDLHPFIALALRLKTAGRRPVIAGPAAYRAAVEQASVEFAAIRPDLPEVSRLLGLSPAEILAQMAAGGADPLRDARMRTLRASFDDTLAAAEGAGLVVATGMATAAYLAAEMKGTPIVAATLQPAWFDSTYDRAKLELASRLAAPTPQTPSPRGVPEEVWAAPLHALREELGLPRLRVSADKARFTGVQRIMGMYSPLMGSVQPDYPPGVSLTGFCVHDGQEGRTELSPELESFLEAGPAPFVFALGSTAVLLGEAVLAASLEAVRALRARAVLTLAPSQLESWRGHAGPDVFVGAYEPYSALFPRAGAVIHHGGVGTAAQALRAGRPQLVVPFFADQPDNAARLVRLGVALALQPARYTAEAAAQRLQMLSSQTVYARAAQRAATMIAREDGPGAAVRIIEAVLRNAQPS